MPALLTDPSVVAHRRTGVRDGGVKKTPPRAAAVSVKAGRRRRLSLQKVSSRSATAPAREGRGFSGDGGREGGVWMRRGGGGGGGGRGGRGLSRTNRPLFVALRAGPNVVWETHHVTLTKAPTFGFGIAVSGGRDSPHFASGDPSVAISDVLKAGPAEGRLQINDRIVTVNGISLENVDHATAINVLRDCGNTVNLVVRRRILLPASDRQSIPFKIVLNKKSKKDDFGIVLGYKLFIAEIAGHSLAAHEPTLKEGDTVLKINNTPVENLSLPEARKLIEKSKEKLQLIVSKGRREEEREPTVVGVSPLLGHDTDFNPGPAQRDREDVNIYRPSVRSEDDIYVKDPTSGRHAVPPGAYPNSENTRYDGHYVLDNDPPPRAGLVVKGSDMAHRDDLDLLPSGRGRDLRDGYYSDREDGWRGREELPPLSQPGAGEYIEDDVFPNRSIHERYVDMRSDICLEPRQVTFPKDKQTGLGLRLAGGNATGIFIASVQQGSAAEREGLVEGDQIVLANEKEISGLTREEAVSYLTSLMGEVTMVVQYRKEDYDRIMASHEAGDAFYIRTHFSYTATDSATEHSFKEGDIFLVKDTLFRGMCWLAVKTSEEVSENKKGTIPSSKTAELLKSQQKEDADKENFPARGRGSLFKRKSSRRAKSLGKDHWDEVMFEDEDSEDAGLASKFPAYERVLLRDADFMRPVVIYGAVSDIARERLLAEYPDRFDAPQVERSSSDGEKKGKSAIIRLGAIREAISRRKHCLLDVTPQNVDRLNYAQFHPVVVYLKADGKQAIKDVRSRWKTMSRNPRKLLEHNEKIERMYSHLFTGVLSHMGTDAWFPKLCKMIDSQQRQQVWMSEKQPTEDMSDDFMFPMSTRMSFGAGADSDLDLPRPRDDLDVSPLQKKRLVRSSSDPSVNTHENIPGIPPYPSPPTYKNQRIPSHDSRVSTSETSPRSPPRDADYQMHPEDRYYPSYYSDQMMHPSHYPANRAHIDPYATLTPSERLRPRVHAEHFQGGFDEFGPYRERLERSDQAASLSPGSVSQQGQPPMSSVAGQPPGPPSQGGQPGAYTDGSSQSSDSYSKYVSSPQNKHDDTKLREKFGSLHLSGREKSPGHDPYRFTRSTANPVTGNVDRAKLSDLSAKYRRQDSQTKGGPAVKSPGQTPSGQPPEVNGGQPVVKKKEPPPVPVKTYSLKQRGIEPDEMKMRNYENSNRAYNYSDVNNSSSRFGGPSPAGGSTPPLPPPPSSAALYMGQSDADRPYEYMSLRQAQDSLFAGGGGSGSGGGNNSRVDQSPQQLPSGTPPHHQNIHAGYSNNSNSNNMSPSSLYQQQQQQQQHQNRLPPPPHHHQQQQHPSPHHHHQPYSQQQQQQQQFQLSGRGASLDSAVGPLPHTHAHPHHTPPPPTAGQDFYDSPKAYANEVYMDHRELSRSRAGGSGGGGGGGPGASSWDPTGYPPPTSSQQQQQMDRGRDEYASLQMPPGGYVRPR